MKITISHTATSEKSFTTSASDNSNASPTPSQRRWPLSNCPHNGEASNKRPNVLQRVHNFVNQATAPVIIVHEGTVPQKYNSVHAFIPLVGPAAYSSRYNTIGRLQRFIRRTTRQYRCNYLSSLPKRGNALASNRLPEMIYHVLQKKQLTRSSRNNITWPAEICGRGPWSAEYLGSVIYLAPPRKGGEYPLKILGTPPDVAPPQGGVTDAFQTDTSRLVKVRFRQ